MTGDDRRGNLVPFRPKGLSSQPPDTADSSVIIKELRERLYHFLYEQREPVKYLNSFFIPQANRWLREGIAMKYPDATDPLAAYARALAAYTTQPEMTAELVQQVRARAEFYKSYDDPGILGLLERHALMKLTDTDRFAVRELLNMPDFKERAGGAIMAERHHYGIDVNQLYPANRL